MDKNSNEELKNISGGQTINGPIISACTDFIEMLYNVGRGVGIAIRRIYENNLGPLE